MEKLERTIGEVESDLNEEPAPDKPTPKKVKKVAKSKKAAKKVSKKSASRSESSDGKVKLADLASEVGITAAAARRKLRAANLSRDGRWAWEEGSKELKAARKALEPSED